MSIATKLTPITGGITTLAKFKLIQTTGFLAYEYNPFMNYRLSKRKYWKDELGRYLDYQGDVIHFPNGDILSDSYLEAVGKSIEDFPEFKINEDSNQSTKTANKLFVEYYEGELVDLVTKDLKFDINHPVDIEVQESYDKSVNLIINDDNTLPKLINSRFTVLENGRYEIIDRFGNNDTNIYTEEGLNIDSALYKNVTKIPQINFNGVFDGGNLLVGNYVLYFKYVDADDNESDFIGESGIISVFKGDYSSPKTVKGGISEENSYKFIRLNLYNIDSNYNYINVYYTRSSGTYNKTEDTKAYKILQKYPIQGITTTISISGFEEVRNIPIDEINISYNIVDKVKTQAQAQSRLFFGNVSKPDIPYSKLAQLSLNILPTPIYKEEDSIGFLDENYIDISNSVNKYEYYNPNNIYYRLGYWEDYYRFAVVYILPDYTLSPAFNIRGGVFSNGKYKYSSISSESIDLDENGFIISKDPNRSIEYENGYGVVKMEYINEAGRVSESAIRDSNVVPLGISFEFSDKFVVEELQKYTKGFFIVRQKRIPTIYCQGITIGLDEESHLPLLPTTSSGGDVTYITESFFGEDRVLTHDYSARLRYINNLKPLAAIIPEAELNSELYSQLFSAAQFRYRLASHMPLDSIFSPSVGDERHYKIDSYKVNTTDRSIKNVTLTYIDDNIQLKSSGNVNYSSRAGEAEVAYKVAYLQSENKLKNANNLIRGAYSAYVGLDGFSDQQADIFEVMIPGYTDGNITEYIKIRGNDTSPFYSISQRYSWEDFKNLYYSNRTTKTTDSGDSYFVYRLDCYRGDCFIGNYTHRMMRNFQDPEAPTNDTIIDENTWIKNYSGYSDGALDEESAANINRGDVNAVKIGHWATFKCLSNINLALRCEDSSDVSEVALVGHPKTFYPYTYFSPDGEYKISDSTSINVGFNSTTSDKYNFILPDIPYIKNNFANRIMYSDLFISDAFKNNYRTFQLNNYKDYSSEYGYITKIEEWFGNLMVIFEHGVGFIPIKEKGQIGQGEGGPIYLNSIDILPEKPLMLSKIYGSQWKDSIIKSQRFIYGVDTVGKKIWRTDGREFHIISDFKIQKFLNDNISLSERERSPIMGIRNVKSHYNAFKQDILFTFFDDYISYNNLGIKSNYLEWNMCFNESLNIWVTRYSWIPLVSGNIYNVFFSYDKEAGKNISGVSGSWKNSLYSEGIVLDGIGTNLNVSYNGVEIEINPTYPYKIGTLTYKLEEGDSLDLNTYTLKYSLYDKEETGEYLIENNKYFDIDSSNTLILKDGNPWKEALQKDTSEEVIIEVKVKVSLYRDLKAVPVTRTESLFIRKSLISTTGEHNIQTGSWMYRHGQAGIFDNTETIKPCRWYRGTTDQTSEPFEFEFIVNDNAGLHKIFNNLDIISNKVFPEEIEYEIIGDCFNFEDLKDISYKVQSKRFDPTAEKYTGAIIKFTQESKTDQSLNTEFYINPDLNNQITFRKIMKVKDYNKVGRLKGNTQYKEDIFDIQLAPIKYKKYLYDEGVLVWKLRERDSNNQPIGNLLRVTNEDLIPSKEIRPKDKFIKIRIKYRGDKLALVTSLRTFYNISYS